MKKVGERSQPVILKELVDAITQAEGACSQLIHALPDPRFMVVREALEIMKEGCISLAPKGYSTNKTKVIV